MTSSMIALWTIFAAIAAWGSFHFAMRDPRSTSLMKITFAGVLIVVFGVALASLEWLPASMIGEGWFAHAMLFIVWLMAAVGAPLCIGSIIGILTGLYLARSRHHHAA
jgi:hypothetical protein